jgi:hypothetical protein
MQADPVKFEDYKHDMDELGAQAAAVVEKMAREQKDMLRTLWLLIHAAGGKVSIHDRDTCNYDPKRAEIQWSRNEHDMTTELVALQKSA